MQHDPTTLKDLSILGVAHSVFQLLDDCVTSKGRQTLRQFILQPPASFEELTQTQATIRFIATEKIELPTSISNGTLVMLEKFFESADHIPQRPSGFQLLLNKYFQKAFNRNEYTFTQFSISHLADFIKGCTNLTSMLSGGKTLPLVLKEALISIQQELDGSRLTAALLQVNKDTPFTEMATLSYEARRELKAPMHRLIQWYGKLDAWFSIAKAATTHNWVFPSLLPSSPIRFTAAGLYHPLLKAPKSYPVSFQAAQNLLVLTGANMSGKTTFMRALGIATFLAHIGSAVPAAAMEISFLKGIITNMHVEDNIQLGESLFMAEVQRIKHTTYKVISPEPHLILMDELFKGTNVHDAFECTKSVLEGLLLHPHHIIVLSTHLYEVAQQFKQESAIRFGYFETDLSVTGSYRFTYELKLGISNDRIGKQILEKEGVIKLLKGNRD